MTGKYSMETEGRSPVKHLGLEIISPEDKCDTMETSVKVQATTLSRHATVRKRCLVEVFAVLCLEKEETPGIDQIIQENLVLLSITRHSVTSEYVLYDISCDKHLQINSEDYLMLTGPDCGIEVEEYFSLCPSYDVSMGTISSMFVWDNFDNLCEIFMSDWLESNDGLMVVHFAVYRGGLEARIELTISDLELHGMPVLKIPLEVYGTVQTSNSAVPHNQAKSYLFDHVRSDNCPILELDPSSKAEVPLPLSRRVTVIPRESTLIVDVSLSLRCSSGDIQIANEFVSFHPSTRSNCNVEEHIIKGQHAKVKVKVTWIEALDYDKAREEEVAEDGEAVDEECDREDEDGAESVGISDSDCSSDDEHSFGSHKMRRLSSSQDISIRPNDYHSTEAMEVAEWREGASLHLKSPERIKQRYLEVFSVKLLHVEMSKTDEIYGFIMIDTGVSSHLLFRRLSGYPSRIDSEGFAILEGPRRCGWNVRDEVSFHPFLLKYQEPVVTDDQICCDLWRDPYYDKSHYDKLLSKTLNTDVGRIKVNFVVYEDGVEAHLTVMLTDCCFSWARVHGTITASNSMLQNTVAESLVLKKDKAEADRVTVGPGREISLPLSRPIVALPFNSVLTLRFDISSEDESIICQAFEFPVQLVGEDERTLPGRGCGVKVHWRFFSYQSP